MIQAPNLTDPPPLARKKLDLHQSQKHRNNLRQMWAGHIHPMVTPWSSDPQAKTSPTEYNIQLWISV